MLLLNYIRINKYTEEPQPLYYEALAVKKYKIFYKKVLTQRGSRSYTIYRLNVAHAKHYKTYNF